VDPFVVAQIQELHGCDDEVTDVEAKLRAVIDQREDAAVMDGITVAITQGRSGGQS